MLSKGVTEERARKLSKAQRFAWCIVLRELEGKERFNWKSHKWERLEA